MTISKLEEYLEAYPDPSFEELLRLGFDLGMITEYEASMFGVRLRCATEEFTLGVDEAEILMRGLLLGYFYGHSRDDLSLAHWHD